MLVFIFVIMSILAEKCRNYASTFFFKLCKNTSQQLTSKWQTHLPYLQLETLLMHNYIIHYDFPGYTTVLLSGQKCWVHDQSMKSLGPKTSHKCKLYQQRVFRKIDEHYLVRYDELCQKLCQHNLSKPIPHDTPALGSH